METLHRLADNPNRCQPALDELDGAYVFYADFEPAIRELLARGASLDDDEEPALTTGQRQKALALWAIHQAACELTECDEAQTIAAWFGGRIPRGVHLTPLPA